MRIITRIKLVTKNNIYAIIFSGMVLTQRPTIHFI